MPTYFTLLTPAGLAKVANAQLTNEKIEISQVAVGDGNGSAYQPLGTETTLKREVWRGGIASIEIDSQNPNWIVVEGVIPASAGGFTIREVGLFDTDGAMIAIGNYPDTYKPVIADGSTMDLALRTIIEVNNASSVTLRVDPNVIVASRAYVDSRIAGSIGGIGTDLTALSARVTTHLSEDAKTIKVKRNVTISATNWVDDTANSGFFIYNLSDSDINSNTVVDVNIHLSSLDTAESLKSVVESFDGYVRLYADENPVSNIIADLKLIRELGVV